LQDYDENMTKGAKPIALLEKRNKGGGHADARKRLLTEETTVSGEVRRQ